MSARSLAAGTRRLAVLVRLLPLLAAVAPPAAAQAPPSDTADTRVARVVAAVEIQSESLRAMIAAAEGADDCGELAVALNGWAADHGAKVEMALIAGYTNGLLPTDFERANVVDADMDYLAELERWSEVTLVAECETDDAFQGALTEQFADAFGCFRGGAGEFSVYEEDLAALPVFAELVACMEALVDAVGVEGDADRTCGALHRRLNAWWNVYGERYLAARAAACETEFLEHDEDTSLAELQAYAGLPARYEELLDWMEEPPFECIDDASDRAELSPALAAGLDLPPFLDDWGRPEDTYENRKSTYGGNPFGRDADEEAAGR